MSEKIKVIIVPNKRKPEGQECMLTYKTPSKSTNENNHLDAPSTDDKI